MLDSESTKRLLSPVMGRVFFGSQRLRGWLWLLAALAIPGCGEPDTVVAPGADGQPAALEAVAQGTAPTVRQGPMRVTCYKDEEVVFEHGTIYRVFRPYGEDAGWSYETGDGLKFRGRIGENVNCVWR